MATKPSIVFLGSGPVAARSLDLLSHNFGIEAVITKPRLAHHRGSVPVIEVAQALNLSVILVSDRQELESKLADHSFVSQLAVLIDFGIIVSAKAIDQFPLGIVNSHFSLLPEWRGADPITFSILSGQKVTGVSLMLLVEKMDEGPLLAQTTYELNPTITTPELTRDLVELSNEGLKAILPLYLMGSIQPAPQLDATMAMSKTPSYSRKLTKADGVIDWHKSAVLIEREVRAFLEWPKSRTTLGGKDIIVTKAHVVDKSGQPGTVVRSSNELVVYCGQKALVVERLKPANRSEMTSAAFLAGLRGTTI